MGTTLKLSIIDNPTMKVGRRIVEKEEFFTKCPTCGKEITGNSEKRLEYALLLHQKLSHGEQISPAGKR